MGAHDDFRRAIIATPDDDAPRLVYADWLDENDDPEQASYIRESIALARLPEYDPDRIALRVTAQRRWHQHSATWGPPLPDDVDRVQWQRGFLDLVTLPYTKLSLLKTILQQHPVRVLYISVPPTERDRSWSQALENQRTTETVQALQNTPEAQHLRRVQWLSQYRYGEGTDLTSVPTVRAQLASVLTGVDVFHAANVTLERLRAYGHLHVTRLAGPAYDNDLHLLAEHPFTRLMDADFARGNLTAEGIRSLIAAPWAAQLETLNLGSCGLRPDALSMLAHGHFPKLHTLRLPLNWVNRSAATTLLQAKAFPALRYLDLGDNDLYNSDIAAIAELPLLHQLHALDLRRNAIRHEAASALALSPAFANLRYLNLADNLMGDDALRQFLRTTTMPNLVHLDVHHNQLKMNGLYALVNSGLLPQLRSLRVTIEQATPAAPWSHFLERGTALEELDLQGSVVDCEALLRGATASRLLALNLTQTGLGATDIEALAQSPLAAQLGELHLANVHIPKASAKVWDTVAKSPLAESLALLETDDQVTKNLRRVFGKRLV